MWHNSTLCLPLELENNPKDEVAVKWDFRDEQYVLLAKDGQVDLILHEDGTFRKPHPHALALAWSTARSMNKRIAEGRSKRL